MRPTNPQSGKVYIIYNSKDRDLAKKMDSDLRECGFPTWFDKREIKAGDSLIDRMNEGLADAVAFILLWSRNSAASKWVREESSAAAIKRIEAQARIIPVKLDDTPLPPLLSHLRRVDLRGERYRAGLDEILDALLGREMGPPVSPLLKHGPSGRPEGVAFRGATASILTETALRANRDLRGDLTSDEAMEMFGLTAQEYAEAAEELAELDLVYADRNASHPSGYERTRIRPSAFVQVLRQLAEVDVPRELRELLDLFGEAEDGMLPTETIFAKSGIPLPRMQLLWRFFEGQDMVKLVGGATGPNTLPFYRADLRPRGRRVLRGEEPMPLA